MKDFSGRVAAITGAGSGIGKALAMDLARRRCALALADIDAQRVERVADECRQHGVHATTARVDVADRDAVIAWSNACREDHGRVNMIFNNAGVSLSAPAESMKIEDFRWLMDINFWGVVHGTQAFLPHLRASGEGHVVNISSIFGIMAMPTQSAYNAAKFAVRGYTEALRMELEMQGAPVSATCVHPGGVATDIARAARIDPAVLNEAGVDEATMRDRTNRMLQVTQPEAAARQILRGVERNDRRVLVGPDANRMDFLVRLLGHRYQPLVMKLAVAAREGKWRG